VFWSLCRAPFSIAKLNQSKISGDTISQMAVIHSRGILSIPGDFFFDIESRASFNSSSDMGQFNIS